ncbi:alpha/beta hydrolase [Alicyclobacillus acidoterrestris]|uniref:alpha/beta hydrolase n=1 Tax=Alicyclobacillus TaxID=29330 RepID=UPI001195ABF7|nr:esterase [Alicyclobacillus suci]GEO27737.1 phospholipase [Alicyclobacillus acidoterrestris]
MTNPSPYQYVVHVPEKASRVNLCPVIFALHGIGYDEQHLVNLLGDLKEQYILIGIRGDLTYQNGYAYYFLKDYGNPERDLFDNSITKLTQFIEWAAEVFPIDRSAKYLIGFSQGAILSMSLGLVLGETIRGIVAMNGYIPGFVKDEYATKPLSETSVLLAHSSHDEIFPVEVGHDTYEYLREHARDVKYVVYSCGHEVSSEHQFDAVHWFQQQLVTGAQS